MSYTCLSGMSGLCNASICIYSFMPLAKMLYSKPLDRSLWGSLDYDNVLLRDAFDWVPVPTSIYLSFAVIGG